MRSTPDTANFIIENGVRQTKKTIPLTISIFATELRVSALFFARALLCNSGTPLNVDFVRFRTIRLYKIMFKKRAITNCNRSVPKSAVLHHSQLRTHSEILCVITLWIESIQFVRVDVPSGWILAKSKETNQEKKYQTDCPSFTIHMSIPQWTTNSEISINNDQCWQGLLSTKMCNNIDR